MILKIVSLFVIAMAAAPLAKADLFTNPLPQEDPAAWSLAVSAHNGAGAEFDQALLRSQTQNAIAALVAESARILRADGDEADAVRLETEWRDHYSGYFIAGLDILDVGDFAPLNVWFADTYKHLRDRFGSRISTFRILDDLNTLNYTIPVVFQPRGNQRTNETWDANEYRMHFVPFAGVVTYWGTYGGCELAFRARPEINKYCKRAANLLSRGMVQFVAPKLADRLYKRANKLPIEIYVFDFDAEVQNYLTQY